MIGTRFGRLVVVAKATPRVSGGKPRPYWLCRCDCGANKEIIAYSLRSGDVLSCGCLHRERARTLNKPRHGHTAGNRISPEYRCWAHLKERCLNPNDKGFQNYGGRGIKVCDEWKSSFEAFFANIGPRPSSRHSIDRINNDGHYEPGNVRWATRVEQRRNRRDSMRVLA